MAPATVRSGVDPDCVPPRRQAGAHARLDIGSMQGWLRLASLQRRSVEQVAKAARMLATVQDKDPQASATADAYDRDERAEHVEDEDMLSAAR